MARLAGDIEFRPRRLIPVAVQSVMLLEIGGVALGALVVPGLVDTRPVERIAGRQPLLRIEMEPALPTLVLRPAIPGDAQRLIAPAGKGNKVLLERCYTKGVGDFVVVELPVRPVRAHEELAVAPKERRRDVPVGEGHVIEVPAHGLLVRDLHGQVVMRAVPASVLLRMACAADSAADKGGIASTGRVHPGRWCRLRGDVAASFWPHQEANPEQHQHPGDHTTEQRQPLRETPGARGAPPGRSACGGCGLSVSSDSSPSPTWVVSAAYISTMLIAQFITIRQTLIY